MCHVVNYGTPLRVCTRCSFQLLSEIHHQVFEPSLELEQGRGREEVVCREVFVERMAGEREVLSVRQNRPSSSTSMT